MRRPRTSEIRSACWEYRPQGAGYTSRRGYAPFPLHHLRVLVSFLSRREQNAELDGVRAFVAQSAGLCGAAMLLAYLPHGRFGNLLVRLLSLARHPEVILSLQTISYLVLFITTC